MFLWLTSRSLAVDLGVVELVGCYSFYAEGFEYVGLVEPFFHFVYGGSFEELGVDEYEGAGRSCFRLSSFARWSMISTARCLLTWVTVRSDVDTFFTALPSTSFPRYFMTCCLGFPFSHFDSTSAR